MADFLLVVGADVKKSTTQMQKDIREVVRGISANPQKVKVGLKVGKTEINELGKLIRQLNTSPPKVKVKLEVGASEVKALQKQISSIQNAKIKMPETKGSSSAANIAKQYTEAKNSVTAMNNALVKMYSLLNNNKNAASLDSYAKLKAQAESFDAVLKTAGGDATKLNAALKTAGLSSADAIRKAEVAMSELKVEMAKTGTSGTTSLKKVSDAATKISTVLNKNSGFKNLDTYKTLENTLSRLVGVVNSVSSGASTLDAALDAAGLSGANAFSGIDASIAAFKASIAGATSESRLLVSGTKEYDSALSTIDAKIKMITKSQDDWTKAKKGAGSDEYKKLSEYINRLETLKNKLLSGKLSFSDYKTELGKVNKEYDNSADKIKRLGENTLSFSDKIKKAYDRFSHWTIVASTIRQIWMYLRKLVTAVIEVDTAMTELKKVTNETSNTYDKFLTRATKRATELGASVSDVVSATADFARLGYGIEQAEKLADVAMVYKNVGDGIEDIDTASESIIATMQAFGIVPEEAMSIVDKFNNVGNKFAISSKGVGDALLRSASAMYSANNTLDETIALTAAANTIVQDPEKVGTTLKTVSMYLRAAKVEAEEAGEATDGMATSVSELREDVLKLTGTTGTAIDIQLDENTFKSTYQILKEISTVWSDMADVDQAALLELIGGKRNANVVSALLENFTVAEKALAESASSAGSALAENEKHLDSIQGKISKFKAQFQAFSITFLDSDFAKGVVEFGTGIMTVLTWIAKGLSAVGGLKTVLTGLIATLIAVKTEAILTFSIKTFSSLVSLPAKIATLVTSLGGLAGTLKKLKTIISLPITNLKKLATAIYLTTTKMVAFKKMGTAGETTSQTFAKALNAVGLSAKGAQIAMGALTAAISIGVILFTHLKQKAEEAREEIIELGKEAEEENDSLSSIVEQYEALGKDHKIDTSEQEKAKSLNEEILSLLYGQNDAIDSKLDELDLVNGRYDAEITKLKEIQKLTANKNYAALFSERKAVSEELIKSAVGSWYDYDEQVGTLNTSEELKFIKTLAEKYDFEDYLKNKKYQYSTSDVHKAFELDGSNIESTIKSYKKMGELITILSTKYHNLTKDGAPLEEFLTDLSTKYASMTDSINEYLTVNEKFIKNAILADVSDADTYQKYSNLINLDKSNLAEYASDAKELINDIANGIGENYDDVARALGLEDVDDLDNNIKRYNELTDEILACNNAKERMKLIAEQNKLGEEIGMVGSLVTQYDSLTAAYNRWITAKESANEGSEYDNMISGFSETSDLLSKGLIGTDDFQEFVKLISAEDLTLATPDMYVDAYNKALPVVKKYFTENKTGINTFISDLQKANSEWAKFNSETGKWEFGKGLTVEDIAESLNISEAAVEAIIEKAEDYGIEIEITPKTEQFEDGLDGIIEESNKKLKELGKINFEFNINTDEMSDITDQIIKAKAIVAGFKDKDGKINIEAEGANEAVAILTALIQKKQEIDSNSYTEFTFNADTADTEVEKAAAKMQKFKELYNRLEVEIATGQDTTDTMKEITDLAGEIDSINDDIKVNLGIDTGEVAEAINSLSNGTGFEDIKIGLGTKEGALSVLNNTVSALLNDNSASHTIWVNAGLNDTAIVDYMGKEIQKDATIVFDKEFTQGYLSWFSEEIVKDDATVLFGLSFTKAYNDWINKKITKTATVVVTTTGGGTARGTAFADGNWGASKSGTALGGELGQELVVRDGRFFTIGDDGAEFFHYKKDDIIFNAEQTRQIFEKGRITTGNRRGRALADGNASASGLAFADGTGGDSEKKLVVNSISADEISTDTIESSTDDNVKSTETYITDVGDLYDIHGDPGRYINDLLYIYNNSAKGDESKQKVKDKIASGVDDDLSNKEDAIDAKITQKEEAVRVGNYEEADRLSKEIASDYSKLYDRADAHINMLLDLGYSEDSDEVRKIVDKKHDYNDKKLEYDSATYEDTVSQIDDRISTNEGLRDEALKKGNYSAAEEFAGYIAEDYARLETNASNEIERLTKAGYDYDSPEVQELVQDVIDYRDKKEEYLSAPYEDKTSQAEERIAINESLYERALAEGNYTEADKLAGYITNDYAALENLASLEIDRLTKLGYSYDSPEIQELLQELSGYTDNKREYQVASYENKKSKTETLIQTKEDSIDLALSNGDYNKARTLSEEVKADYKQLRDDAEAQANYYRSLGYAEDSEVIQSLKQDWITYDQAIKDSTLETFNTIGDEYESVFDDIEHRSNVIETRMDRAESKGLLSSTKYYESLREEEERNLENLEEKKAAQEEALAKAITSGDIQIGSEAFKEMTAEINNTTAAIEESKSAVVDFDNSIRQIKWDRFDYFAEQFSPLRSESEFLQSIIGDDLYYEEDDTDRGDNKVGSFNDKGMAALGLRGMNYNMYMEEAATYENEIKKLDEEIAKNPYDKNLIDRKQTLVGLRNDAILAAEGEKEAIADLVQGGIDLEIEALSELITSYEESLDSAKELYDYQKNIAEQSENIASLEKQIAAYSNDTSEESRMKVQKLKVELEDAKEGLAETQYDKFLSEQSELLETLKSDYEELLNARMDDVDAVVSDTIDSINTNSSDIKSTLESEAESVGLTITKEMGAVWDSEEQALKTYFGADSLIGGFILDKDGFFSGLSTSVTGMNTALGFIKTDVNKMLAYASGEATVNTNTDNDSTNASLNNIMKSNSIEWLTASPERREQLESANEGIGSNLGYTKSNGSWYDKDGNEAYSLTEKEKVSTIVNKMKSNSNAWLNASESDRAKLSKENERLAETIESLTGKSVTKNSATGVWYIGEDELYKKYKHGGLVDYTGLAWLDGTPGNPEMVLNPDDTKAFIAMTNALRDIKGMSLSPLPYSSISERMGGRGFTGDINITIPIEHVEDYNDFVTKLKADTKFEKFVRSVSVDLLAGGSSLSKNKIKW